MDAIDEDLLGENPQKCKVVEELGEELSQDFYIQAMHIEHSYSLSSVADKHQEMVA